METIIYLLTGLIAIAIVAGLIAYCVNRHYTAKECIECVEIPNDAINYDRLSKIKHAYSQLPYIITKDNKEQVELDSFLSIIENNTEDIN